MTQIIDKFKEIGFIPTDILIPKKDINLSKWAVIACDQFTAQSEYWDEVEDYVGNKPSTLNLIYPECFLYENNREARINKINSKMKEYFQSDIFDEYKESFILVKRTINGKERLGLIGALDLDKYDYSKDSKSLIRATEQTIEDRIPTRKQIRKDAILESPHIMVLISDKNKSVIEPIANNTNKLNKIYDFELMKDSGHLEGYLISSPDDFESIYNALSKIESSLEPNNKMLFAMGDGNHSFATAKSCWEDIKKSLTPEEAKNHPAKYCLVEIENIYDNSLIFEPINRILFNVTENEFLSELEKYADGIEFETVHCKNCINLRNKDQNIQGFGYCTKDKHVYVRINKPKYSISASTIQKVLDNLIEKGKKIDYIHGLDTTDELGSKEGNLAIFLPPIPKENFFNAIIKDGSLPRKTFSIGEAKEKRFYMECRNITK